MYRKCGILDYGFVRLYCKECSEERVVGFSCKCRCFCPRCGGRRRDQTAERMVSEVWPDANATSLPSWRGRRWVLTFPHQVRHWLSRDVDLFADVISEVTGVISRFYENHTIHYIDRDHFYAPSAGVISFVQLFGSSLTLNPHLHMIFLDGVYGWAWRSILSRLL